MFLEVNEFRKHLMFDCALVLEKSVIEFDMCIGFAIYKVFDFKSFRAFILQLDEEFVAFE